MGGELDGLPVGEVSRLTGVTVRTLHHYDQVGLLVPAGRSASGYRLYGKADLEKLRRILGYRELGFGLDEIAALLAEETDLPAQLRRQRQLVEERIARLRRIAAALDRELEAHRMGISLTPEEQFEVFGTDYSEHVAEAEQRWGNTEAFHESQRRTARYGKQDWLRIKAEQDEIEQAFARAMADGVPTGSGRAAELAERHRQHLSTWFHDVPPEMHRGLAELYLADPRFAEHYDRIAAGLAAYLSAVIIANAERQGTG
jgi:DNA-binding transcriptional MerR regulator